MKVKVIGKAVVIVSSISEEKYFKMARFAKESLTQVVDDKPVFRISYGSDPSLTMVGATFNHTHEGNLAMTQLLHDASPDAVLTIYGNALKKLEEFEAYFTDKFGALEEKITSIESKIEVVE